jgi:glycosyltransferase involved in cell wall biosynthesis
VFLLDAVPPSELLRWTASADVMLMAIQPTTLNHRHTTPQKLFEALAAGVPIVASDLPAMAAVVTETGAGVLCDPTSPASIAAAIRSILELAPTERDALRTRALRAAHDRYNWERQTDVLFRLYRRLLGAAAPAPAAAPAAPAAVPGPSPAPTAVAADDRLGTGG